MIELDTYGAYLRAFGKAASGTKVSDDDFCRPRLFRGWGHPRPQAEQAAVALGIHDAYKDRPIRSRADVEVEVGRLTG